MNSRDENNPEGDSSASPFKQLQNHLAEATEKALAALPSDAVETFKKHHLHRLWEPLQRIGDEIRRQTEQLVENEKSQESYPQHHLLNPRVFKKWITIETNVFRSFRPEIEASCCQVWTSQGNAITPDFMRGLLSSILSWHLKAQEGVTRKEINSLVQSQLLSPNEAKLRIRLLEETYELEINLQQNHCEARAIELEYEQRSTSSAKSPLGIRKRTKGRRRGKEKDEEVAKRRAIVKANPDIPADEMCELWERKGVPRSGSAAKFHTWPEAYLNSKCRKNILSTISRDKNR